MTIWQEWIEAHNDRDFDKIAAMNGDTFKVMLPNGQRIVGSDEHRALLEGWIAEANTTWEIWWMIPTRSKTPMVRWKIGCPRATC